MRTIISRLRGSFRTINEMTSEELLTLLLSAIEKGIMAFCLLGAASCLLVGFKSPHAFIMAPFFVFVAGLVKANRKERGEEE